MPIDRNAIQDRLKKFDFSGLFTQELGWDWHTGNLSVAVDGQHFSLTAIAHKRGMVAYHCPAPAGVRIPEYALRRKIEQQVTKSAHEHLIIFTDSAMTTQIWQWVKREPGKPAACREHTYHKNQSGEALIQKLQTIAFSLEEEETLTLVDVVTQTRKGFDVEHVTKRFYDQFKKEHANFLKFIEGIDDAADRQWYASVMLNRLMFIYFIQKKGFLDGDPDYLRNRLKRCQQEMGKNKFYSFYRCFLLKLFHDGLGGKARPKEIQDLLGNIPYLNGGFFEKHVIEQRWEKIQIPDRAFERIFDYFDQYQWHLDERPLRADNEINPDVLGFIFEKYINQKQMGAYYTKEDITGYMSRNTIIPFLFDAARKEYKSAFEGDNSVWKLLQADPDRYIYPAIKHGIKLNVHTGEKLDQPLPLPPDIAAGINPPGLREPVRDVKSIDDIPTIRLRRCWNKPAPPEYALPTEIWREVIARRQRYEELHSKLANGQVHDINDFITLNLDIVQFAQDVIRNCDSPELLRAFWHALEKLSVLDPTVGSGAFLFAALNILKPLYEACLERMEAFVGDYDRGTGVPPVETPAVPPVGTHGQDAHATHGWNPYLPVQRRQGAYLPHWTLEGATYAVTFRQFDALPASVWGQWVAERDNIVKTARQMQRELSDSERERLDHLHSEKVEQWLDAGHGCCFLRDPRVAELVTKALAFFDGERYELLAWCVMPNHVHVVFRPLAAWTLPKVLHSWKSYTSKQANAILGRSGEFWQDEYYDHLIRNEADFERQVRYVLENPAKAGLTAWPWLGRAPGLLPRLFPPGAAPDDHRGQHGSGTGVPPVDHPAVSAVGTHGQDAHATIKWNPKKFSDFRAVLERVDAHPNSDYFILKSIILNNLFGVDIMEEATEICKLRLFLKLAAQVDPDPAKDNFGIEPLPDIDFNIRAGNTLVGYATADEVRWAFKEEPGGQGKLLLGDSSSAYKRFEENVELADRAFRLFREMQTDHGMDNREFADAKKNLRQRLKSLEDELNRCLAADYGINTSDETAYANWLKTHQPFHWFVEFYGIVTDGGFDVIMGNPPYVSAAKVRKTYAVKNLKTLACPDIYAWVLERMNALLRNEGRSGMIVPLSLGFSGDFAEIRNVLYRENSLNWFSSFGRIPSALFNFDVRVRNTIHLGKKSRGEKTNYTTRLHRWFDAARPSLFSTLEYAAFRPELWKGKIPKLNTQRLVDSFQRLLDGCKATLDAATSPRATRHVLYFKKTAYNWLNFCRELPPCFEDTHRVEHTKFGEIHFPDGPSRDLAMLLANGKWMFAYWCAISDDFDVTRWNFAGFPADISKLGEKHREALLRHVADLEEAMIEATQFKLNAGRRVGNYNLAKCRHVTDKTDLVFADALGIAEAWDDIELYYVQVVKTDFSDDEEE